MANLSGAIRAGAAYVELLMNDTALVRGLRSAQKKLRNFGSSVKAIGVGITAIGGAALSAFGVAAKVFSSMGDAVAKMSKRTGVSVESLSELAFVASQTGTNFSTLENAFRRMQRSIVDGERGLSTVVDAYDQLGISVKDLQGLRPEEQFKVFADALSKVEDSTQKAGLAMMLFGRSGTNLLPMFEHGAAGIEALQKEARKLGLTLSKEDAVAAEKFTDQLDKLTKVAKVAAFNVGAALAGTLGNLADNLTNAMVKTVAWIRENKALIATVAKLAAGITAAGLAITGIGVAVLGASAAFGVIATIIGALLSPMGLLAAAIAAMALQFFDLKKTGLEAFGGIADALKAGDIEMAAAILWLGLNKVWTAGISDITMLWELFKLDFLDTAAEAFFGAAKILETAIANMKKAMAGLEANIKDPLNKIHGWLAEQMAKLPGLFGNDVDASELVKNIRAKTNAVQSGISQDAQGKIAKIDQELKETLAANKAAASTAKQSRSSSALAAIKEAAEAAQEAKNDLSMAVKEAKSAAATKGAGGAGGDWAPAGTVLAGIPLLPGEREAAAEAEGGSSASARGTFNAAALLGLKGTSRAEDKIAKNTERTVDAIEKNTRAVKESCLSFS